MTPASFRIQYPRPDIALVEIDVPGKRLNVLSREVLRELASVLDSLATRVDLAGLILISAKPDSFVAGADVKEFAARIDLPTDDVVELCRAGQTLFRRLAETPFPTVAAIHGLCLGGGAELALWCDARILTDHPKTEYGFPEVKLGLLPAWGGTVRTVRMLGPANALQLITSGQPLSVREAKQAGLAQDVVAPSNLLNAALQTIDRLRSNHLYPRQRLAWAEPVALAPAEVEFLRATSLARIQAESGGQYPAPLAAVNLVATTHALSLDDALAHEARVFASLYGSPVNRALLNVFLLTDRAKKGSLDTTGTSDNTSDINYRAGVIGAGIMGAGIAAANVKRGLPTQLVDADENALSRGTREVLEEAAYDKLARGPSQEKFALAATKLQSSRELASLASCQLVVEAIVEEAAAKTNLLRSLEDVVAPQAVLGSNTSTISISHLAQGLRHPERFCGIHFFNPVRRMQVVEIIRGKQTSVDTLAHAVQYVRRLSKFPLVVNDSPGFLVNRLLSPYLNASLEMLSQGVSPVDIDRAATEFGMPIGPLSLYDLVGIDTAFRAGKVMWSAFPRRYIASPILPALLKTNRLGMKNGRGFYTYGPKNKQPELDAEINAILETYTKTKLALTRDEITLRLLLPMLLEATLVLEENIVSDVRDVDIGMIFGLGFPAFRGGLLYWADQQGPAKLAELAASLSNSAKNLALTPLMETLARENRRFYDLAIATRSGGAT